MDGLLTFIRQCFPGYGIIPDLWVVAQLQSIRCSGLGPAASRRHHPGRPVFDEGLDPEGPEYRARNWVEGRLLGCVGGYGRTDDMTVMSAVDFISTWVFWEVTDGHGQGEACFIFLSGVGVLSVRRLKL